MEPGAVAVVTWRSGAPPLDPTAAALTVAALLLLIGAVAAVRQGKRAAARAAKPAGSDSVPVGAVVRTPRDSEELVG
jgi:hypothetical protein